MQKYLLFLTLGICVFSFNEREMFASNEIVLNEYEILRSKMSEIIGYTSPHNKLHIITDHTTDYTLPYNQQYSLKNLHYAT